MIVAIQLSILYGSIWWLSSKLWSLNKHKLSNYMIILLSSNMSNPVWSVWKKSFPICDNIYIYIYCIYIYISLSLTIHNYIFIYMYVLIHIHLIYFHINRNIEIGVPIDLIIIFPIETPRLEYLHFKRNSVVHSCTISETSHHLCFLPEHFKISGWDSRY